MLAPEEQRAVEERPHKLDYVYPEYGKSLRDIMNELTNDNFSEVVARYPVARPDFDPILWIRANRDVPDDMRVEHRGWTVEQYKDLFNAGMHIGTVCFEMAMANLRAWKAEKDLAAVLAESGYEAEQRREEEAQAAAQRAIEEQRAMQRALEDEEDTMRELREIWREREDEERYDIGWERPSDSDEDDRRRWHEEVQREMRARQRRANLANLRRDLRRRQGPRRNNLPPPPK